MTHRVEQIVDRVVELIPPTLCAVFKHRRLSLSAEAQELPAASVDLGEDKPLDDDGASNMVLLDSLATIEITAIAKESDEPALINKLLALRTEFHQVLMADRTLGLAFVMDTRYGGAEAPEIDNAGDMPSGRYTTRWFVHYRMNITDPE